MGARKCNGPVSQASHTVAVTDVLAAVRSLYLDQLKPVSGLVRKRLLECAAASQVHTDINMNHLEFLCRGCSLLLVEAEPKGDWSVYLLNCERVFMDVYDPEDPYPQQLWEDFEKYCKGVSGPSRCWSGGRYSCARSLTALNLPCLSGFSLGQISHFVHLALTQKRLLGYSKGCIVPYRFSDTMLKEEKAKQHCPCSAAGPMHAVSWELARGCLWQILQASPKGELPLPNVKRLFRSRFHMDLSETALGYSKVSELLQAPQFKDICEVEQRGLGYIVKPTHSTAQEPSRNQELRVASTAATLLHNANCLGESNRRGTSFTPHLQSSDSYLTPSACLALSQDGYRDVSQNTFIQFQTQPVTPSRRNRRLQTMPAIYSRGDSLTDESTTDASGSDDELVSSSSKQDCLGLTETECGAKSALRTPPGGKRTGERLISFCLDESSFSEGEDPSPLASGARTPALLFPMTPYSHQSDATCTRSFAAHVQI